MRRKYAFISICLTSVCAFAAEWKPINPEELALKTPKIDKNAGAEAIFWDVRVYDIVRGNSIEHHVENYVRIKIFNELGVKSQSTVDIPYASSLKTTIGYLHGRTIKPAAKVAKVERKAAVGLSEGKNWTEISLAREPKI